MFCYVSTLMVHFVCIFIYPSWQLIIKSSCAHSLDII